MKLIDIDLITRGQWAAAFHGLSAETIAQARLAGIAQAVQLRSSENGQYEIIGPPDPWFLAQAIQASQVPALLLDDLSDDEIESLTRTREEGGIIEQAARIHNRLAHYKNKAELARETGVSRSNICHLIRVHKLAEDIKAVIRAHPGKVKLGHAKVLAGLEIEQQRSLLDQVIQYGLSVHETETRAREMRSGEHCQQQHENPQDKPVEVIRLEQEVSQLIGCETRIEPAKHQLVIDYSNIDILDGILTRLGYEGSG